MKNYKKICVGQTVFLIKTSQKAKIVDIDYKTRTLSPIKIEFEDGSFKNVWGSEIEEWEIETKEPESLLFSESK